MFRIAAIEGVTRVVITWNGKEYEGAASYNRGLDCWCSINEDHDTMINELETKVKEAICRMKQEQ